MPKIILFRLCQPHDSHQHGPWAESISKWMQAFLFEKYIPSLKDRAFLSMLDKLRDANPHLTADEAASRTADTVNDVFGGQNWRKLGVSTAPQDFMRMLVGS